MTNSIRFVMGNSYAIRGFVYRNQLSCDVANDYFNRALHAYSIYDDERSNGNQSVVAYNKGNCFCHSINWTQPKSILFYLKI